MTSDSSQIPPESQAGSKSSSWSEVRATFESALKLEGQTRELFLVERCGSNAELRSEVEALLEDHDETLDLLESPVSPSYPLAETESALAAAEDGSLIGTRIGAYRLEREIGRGGMGAVYLATRADSEFDKRVAIKLIRAGLESDFAIRRFRHERQILARLENPYIARLIDGGTTAAGVPYFVMEYVEGQPVTQYCETHSLPVRDRLTLFLKICSAVQYAHERSIIHRDLKPGNILVKRKGTPKLLDFGIAKILSEDSAPAQEATLQGRRMLTPAYASPEQMHGDPATVRSDVYSLGIILYELLCGERPSLGTFQRIGGDSAHPLEAPLSLHLRNIVFRAIRLEPVERYPSVEAFAADIGLYLSGAPPLANSPTTLVAEQPPANISLAVLPFRMRGDQDGSKAFLASGITEALITRLSRIERLSIPPPSAILKYVDGIEAVRAARDLRVTYVLEGSIYDFGDNVRATVQLVFAEAGIAVWAAQIDAGEKDLLRLEDSIAEQVADAVVPHLTGEERAELSRSGTTNGQAHSAYLRGRWHWSHSGADREQLAKALLCFMEATAIDPKYAKAHAGVADYYLRLGVLGGLPPAESFAAALQSARTAIQLEPNLGEAHAALAFAVWAYHRDEETAEKHFNLAITRNPNHASGHHWFGLFNSARGLHDLAIANLERAQKVDPHSEVIAAAVGLVYHNAGQCDTARRLLLDAARELPKSAMIQEMLAWCHLRLGAAGEALEAGRRAAELGDRSSALSVLAHAEAAAGHMGRALSIRDEVEEQAKQRYVSGYDRASIFLATGQNQEALRCLEQAHADRDWWLCWITVDPRWDALRREPRFQKLLPGAEAARRVRIRNAGLAVACLLIAIAAGLVWWAARKPPAPFTNLKFTKLTSNGIADSAVISPDGKTVVYTALETGGTGIWRRDMETGRVARLVPGLSETISNLAFTNQGATVAFVTFPPKQPSSRELYTVPASGGTPVHILESFSGPVGISLDGHSAATYISNAAAGQDELWIVNTESGARHLLTSYKFPERFEWICRPVWSPDGKLIAYAAEQRDKDGYLVRLYAIDTKTGARHRIPSPRWQWIQSVAWTGDKSALAAVGQERESSFQQIWYLPYPNAKGPARRIGNDLDDYVGASLTSRSSELVSVQAQTLSNIYTVKPGGSSTPVQVTRGSGRYFDLSWMPDGRILYASDATGSADLWLMNNDGGGERPITFGTGRSYAPIASPDSKVIAFHSNRSGNWQVWRADADGSHPQQLSNSAADGNWPQFSADGKFILFHQTGLRGAFNLWRVPAGGGVAVQLTKATAMHPAVSRTDGRIAAWYSESTEHPHWKLAIFAPDGGEPLRTFDPTAGARPDTPLRWTPNGDAISFIDYAKGCSNIWLQPVDGRAAYPITTFTSGDIYSFDWSREGTMVYSQGLTTADVVLIRDMNAGGNRE